MSCSALRLAGSVRMPNQGLHLTAANGRQFTGSGCRKVVASSSDHLAPPQRVKLTVKEQETLSEG
jgi:hypothetical protein